MSARVLLVFSEIIEAKNLTSLFKKRGVKVKHVESSHQIDRIIKQNGEYKPDIVVLDLHSPDEDWLSGLKKVKSKFPNSRILFSTDQSDPNLILRAKSYGAKHFLRAPFDDDGLTQALQRMTNQPSAKKRIAYQESIPKVKIPVRVKIIFPYVFLAILIALAAAFVVSQVTRDSVEERFINQLIDSGKLSSDWMVREEERLLGTLRLLLNTQGMSEAVFLEDAERLRELSLPVAVNSGEEAIEILNTDAVSVFTLRRDPMDDAGSFEYSRGEDSYISLEFVQNVLTGLTDSLGDKYIGVVDSPLGKYLYVSGPLLDSIGNPVGVVLVGKSLVTLTRQMRADTMGHISLYDLNGQIITSTLSDSEGNLIPVPTAMVVDVLTNKDGASVVRSQSPESVDYREILGSWEARSGVEFGVLGTALPETFLVRSGESASVQIFILVTVAFLGVIFAGVLIANRITKPLLQVVEASSEIAHGNINVKVEASGSDEIAVLAHSFNRMIDGLQEGSMYRDLLGRTVSPEVRDQLRDTLSSGDIRLEGQFAIATVLMADVQGYTSLSEKEDPATILKWLNELFGALVPIITAHGGVVNEFSGDSMFTFFGILPRPLEGAESAYLACNAAVEMLGAVERVNEKRHNRGEPELKVGIGINTGPVTAGGLGAQDRLHYTIIGDTVNTAQRIESLAHKFDESGIMLSKQTVIALWDKKEMFNLESYGVYSVKGKEEKLLVYRLWPDGENVEINLEMVDLVN